MKTEPLKKPANRAVLYRFGRFRRRRRSPARQDGGGGSGPAGAAAPVVQEGGQGVGEGRRGEAKGMAVSAAVLGDGTEQGDGGSGETGR